VAVAEPVVVFALVLAYSWLLRGRQSVLAGIVLLVLVSHWWRGETPAAIGFRRENFGRCLRSYGWVVLLAGALVVREGLARGGWRDVSPATAAAVLARYCVWGLVQQWALAGFFVSRFAEALGGVRGGRRLAALPAALCFAGAHLPNAYLAGLTFVLGLLSAFAYLRYRNLLFLGLAHGVLGTLLVLFVAPSLPQGLRTGPAALGPRPGAR
jgi:membrane protease YdiL (CAAX protease family)